MTEKVLHEIRFIETDDGFRLEINGDKEKMREMGFDPGMMGFGLGKHFGGFRRGPHGPHSAQGPHRPRGRRMGRMRRRGRGPWAGWDCGNEEFDEADIVEKSPEDLE